MKKYFVASKQDADNSVCIIEDTTDPTYTPNTDSALVVYYTDDLYDLLRLKSFKNTYRSIYQRDLTQSDIVGFISSLYTNPLIMLTANDAKYERENNKSTLNNINNTNEINDTDELTDDDYTEGADEDDWYNDDDYEDYDDYDDYEDKSDELEDSDQSTNSANSTNSSNLNR